MRKYLYILIAILIVATVVFVVWNLTRPISSEETKPNYQEQTKLDNQRPVEINHDKG